MAFFAGSSKQGKARRASQLQSEDSVKLVGKDCQVGREEQKFALEMKSYLSYMKGQDENKNFNAIE